MEYLSQIEKHENWTAVLEALKIIFGVAIIIYLGYLGRNFTKRYPK